MFNDHPHRRKLSISRPRSYGRYGGTPRAVGFAVLLLIAACWLATFGAVAVLAQSINATLSGNVFDSAGAAVPGAEITVVNEQLGIRRQVVSNEGGVYVFPPLPPATYTVTARRDGFSDLTIEGVVLSTSDRQELRIELAAGGVGGTVTVTADTGQLQIQAESGERSELVTNRQIKDLALNGRNYLGLLQTIPGVNTTFTGDVSNVGGLNQSFINGTRGRSKELAIDGSSNVNTGANEGVHVTINPDAIQEVKVLTSNFQAEFGRAGGGNIQVTTLSGTNQYRGNARYFRRHDSLNANSFFDNLQGRPRPLYRYDYFGYNIGGPVVLPRFGEGGPAFFNGRDKLFFFFSQEYYQQLVPNGARNIRVPTLAERNGDFRETRDGNGNQVFIRDPNIAVTNNVRCEAIPTNPQPGINYQGACVRFRGVLNVIDPARFFRDGQDILNIFPLPNTTVGGTGFNYTSQISSELPRREDILRIDYNLSDATRITGRMILNSSDQGQPYGGGANVAFNFPLTVLSQNAAGANYSFTVLHNFSPTLTNEFIFGPSRNRFTISSLDDGMLRSTHGIDFPLFFNNLEGIDYIPQFQFGGIPNQTFPTNTTLFLPRGGPNATYNVIDNVTKVAGSHTLKAGIFYQRGDFTNLPVSATNGVINFAGGNNFVQNPLNTGHPYSNALFGIYNSVAQTNNSPVGDYRYNTFEWYAQDTWKINRRFTLDYGVRFVYLQPFYHRQNLANFFSPERYDPARASRLYFPVTVAGQRRAVDPANRPAQLTVANTLPQSFVGLLVPGSGDLRNGFANPSDGFPRGGFPSTGVDIAPRFGFALDLTGDARTIVRGGFGISYDRLQSNVVNNLLTNPPTVLNYQQFNGRLDELSAVTPVVGPVFSAGYTQDSSVPSVYSFSLGVQRNVGFGIVADVAYVGTLSRHLLQQRDINALPYGTAFRREAQDPSRFANNIVPAEEPGLPQVYRDAGLSFTGELALPANFLRPFPGLGAINFREFAGSSNYHSMQVSVNRRFSRDLTFGVAYTLSKAMVTGNDDFESNNPFDTRRYDYRLASFDRTHIFVTNYVYNTPRLSRFLGGFGDNGFVRGLFDNYQFSGISSYYSGTPFEFGVGIQNVNAVQRLVGTPNVGVGFQLQGNPRIANNGILFNTDALVLPRIGDQSPFPRTYLRSPGFFNHDLSLFKNFPFGDEGGRYLQLRVEAFNVFNQTQFTGINSGVLLGVPVTNAQGVTTINTNAATVFNNYGSAIIANQRSQVPAGQQQLPFGSYFGEFNNTRDARVIQLGVKLYF